MGTRGLYGFRKNGHDKVTYNHFDSYPDYLGKHFVEFCAKVGKKGLNALYDQIELVNEDAKPTDEQIAYCIDHGFGGQGDNWYRVLCKSQGCFEPLFGLIESHEKLYMIDDASFIRNSLFCEFAYIANLDTNELEFYLGFQKSPDEGNRYGTTTYDGRYYPCRCVATFPLDAVKLQTMGQIVEKMNKLDSAPYPKLED